MIVKIDSSVGTRHTSTATKKESKIMATNFQVLGDTDKAIRALAQRGAVVVLYQGHVAVPKIAPKCPGAENLSRTSVFNLILFVVSRIALAPQSNY